MVGKTPRKLNLTDEDRAGRSKRMKKVQRTRTSSLRERSLAWMPDIDAVWEKRRLLGPAEYASRHKLLQPIVKSTLMALGFRFNRRTREVGMTHAPCRQCGESKDAATMSTGRVCADCNAPPVDTDGEANKMLFRQELAKYLKRHPQQGAYCNGFSAATEGMDETLRRHIEYEEAS